MKQIIVRRMTLSDFIINTFYKVRFWYYRNFATHMLSSSSFKTKDNLELVFDDDFKKVSWGNSDENQKWVIGEGWGIFHPDKPEVYYGAPELAKDTLLPSFARFTVKHNPRTFPDDQRTGQPITIPFEVSLLSTNFSFKQQYGRFECRCTIPHDNGVWPAFWLWGSTWPPEIDVFEFFGKKNGKDSYTQEINLHYGDVNEGTKGNLHGWKFRVEKDGENKFHEFCVDWKPNKIEFITDGVRVFRFTNKETLEWFNMEIAKMWIVVNHSINVDYFNLNDTTYYSEFLVDYVRAYKHV
jgi:beta-glucanase (GH16 family)